MNEEIKRNAEISDDDLEQVSGGSGDPFHYQSCTDFRCYSCGYQKTDPEEVAHWCEAYDGKLVCRCDFCVHLCDCSHAEAFMKLYNETR